jgi:hypothetical protein
MQNEECTCSAKDMPFGRCCKAGRPTLADDLRSVLRWESGRLGAISAGVLRQVIDRLDSAPVALMDTRDVLGICAPTEEDFPALYAIQGRRVRLVAEDEPSNADLTGRTRSG